MMPAREVKVHLISVTADGFFFCGAAQLHFTLESKSSILLLGPTVDEVDDKNSAQLGQRFVYVIKVCPKFCRRADFTFMATATSVNMYV